MRWVLLMLDMTSEQVSSAVMAYVVTLVDPLVPYVEVHRRRRVVRGLLADSDVQTHLALTAWAVVLYETLPLDDGWRRPVLDHHFTFQDVSVERLGEPHSVTVARGYSNHDDPDSTVQTLAVLRQGWEPTMSWLLATVEPRRRFTVMDAVLHRLGQRLSFYCRVSPSMWSLLETVSLAERVDEDGLAEAVTPLPDGLYGHLALPKPPF